jgi:hypothetical protein
MRGAVVAGQFYEESFEELDEQIKNCFTDARGPGALPTKKRQGIIKGAVVPHAGYVYSGACAAWAYKAIAESKFPDFFIIMGPSHGGSRSCLSAEEWETPFGVVKSHKSFVKEISKKSGLDINEDAHATEHSIEVQLPFLQFSCKDYLDKIRIVPLIIGQDVDYNGLGVAIRESIGDRNVCVIASSDFTHYGFNYGYVPFFTNRKENMYSLDKRAIDIIKGRNASKFLSYVDKKEATICGAYPIAVLLETLEDAMAQVLQYYTSGDVVGDYNNAVGYAAIVFR